jgi:hypothetical protein
MSVKDEEAAEAIPPLRKRTVDDVLYERRPETTRLISGLLQLPEREALERARISRRSDPGWLRGECLVFMMRRASRRGDKQNHQRWCTLALARIRQQMPHGRTTANQTPLELALAEYGPNRFAMLLRPDLDGYNEQLDIYEAVFDLAVSRLRKDALRTLLPKRDDAEPKPSHVEFGSSPAVDLEVERAKSCDDLFGDAHRNDEAFRSAVWAAIDALPTEQNRILTMMRDGVAPGEMAQILGLEPKTLYNRKQAAMKAVREAMGRAVK